MIEVGQAAPDFSLTDQAGNTVTLEGCKGTPFILYFYPKDDTPGCTKEACAFRDAIAEYRKRKTRILGVSPDDSGSHARFAEKFELPFPLLSDPDHKVCEVFGVWKEKNMYGRKSMGVERTTFIIDAQGVVRAVFPRVKVDGHSDAVIQALDAL
jgi:thioredoxin-dependent peroxiredoxin